LLLPTADALSAPTAASLSHPAEQLEREFPGLQTPIGTGQPIVAVTPQVAPVLAVFAASHGAPDGAPAARGGSSTLGNHPSTPAPAPAPTSSGGGSAAGSGSGTGFSSPFAPVNMAVHAAPTRATERALFSQPSWRTSFFTLIPERPD
jgi:hypothetical protein